MSQQGRHELAVLVRRHLQEPATKAFCRLHDMTARLSGDTDLHDPRFRGPASMPHPGSSVILAGQRAHESWRLRPLPGNEPWPP